jgi:thioredoxin reductase
MDYDAIVVGGSFAGLSAAMQLARARRRILLVDAGRPRNRFAAASHGFLGQDGVAPAAIMREGLSQLLAYPSVDFFHGEAQDAGVVEGGFRFGLSGGGEASGRRVILALGVADELPLPSMKARWGVSVLHCPYCHGYEVRDQPLAVIANNPAGAHQALMLPDWGPTTYFTQGVFEPTGEEAVLLAARGVHIERTPVVELLGPGETTEALQLADGRRLEAHAVFTGPMTRVSSPLAGQLGCAFTDGLTGPHITVDAMQQTSVAGVFAAGDAAQTMHNATLASAAGVLAGVAAHRSLVADEATAGAAQA